MSEQPSAAAPVEGSSPEAPLPDSIGNYEVMRRLGSGPMGDVFMAKSSDETRHAIKVPKAAHVKVSEAAQRMLQAQIDPRVRPYLEIEYDSSRNRYLAMDYLEVRPASLAALDGLDQAESLKWLISCCQALAVLHKQGIVHGNVKSSNILVRRTKDKSIPGTVAGAMPILADVGLRYAYDPEYFVGATAAHVFPYMAPEAIEAFVAAGAEEDWSVGPAADVYAFGVTMIEIYSGFLVFDLPGEDPVPERYLQEKRRRRYVIAERNDHKSGTDIKKLNEVVACCLDPEPKNRFAGAQELEEALQQALVVDGKE